MGLISVAIIEDHAETREGLAAVLALAEGFECRGKYATAEAAIKELRAQPAQVTLLDLRLPKMQGIDCIRELKKANPKGKILVLTVETDSEQIVGAIKAGADGYLLKRKSIQTIPEAIREVCAGYAPLTGAVAREILDEIKRTSRRSPAEANLSPKQSETLVLLAEGSSNKEIASKIGVSVAAVKLRIRHIYQKLQVRGRTEAVAWFFQKGKTGGEQG